MAGLFGNPPFVRHPQKGLAEMFAEALAMAPELRGAADSPRLAEFAHALDRQIHAATGNKVVLADLLIAAITIQANEGPGLG